MLHKIIQSLCQLFTKKTYKPVENNSTRYVTTKDGSNYEVSATHYYRYITPNSTPDWSFIRELEGYRTYGYVPDESNEKNNKVQSGVTICAGFDLGQHTSTYLEKNLKLPKDLVHKLSMYTELKGRAAVNALKAHPLQLSDSEADFIDRAVKQDKAQQIAHEYDVWRETATRFHDLPAAAKTVIMSVGFQYGSLKHRTPNFFSKVVKTDWEGAHKHLLNFGDAYKTRRRKEADYLQNLKVYGKWIK